VSDLRRTRHTGTFLAADANGVQHTLHIFTSSHGVQVEGGVEWVAGTQKLQTLCGWEILRHGRGSYQIVRTGQFLTSDDPNAP